MLRRVCSTLIKKINLCQLIIFGRGGGIINKLTYTVPTTNMSNCSINASIDEVFEYTGMGCVVPKDVTIVRFHPSVVEVENRAFLSCKQLRKVELNDGLKKIGGHAFYDCTSLSIITFYSKFTAIGNAAFANCNRLREVVFQAYLGRLVIMCFMVAAHHYQASHFLPYQHV